MESFVITWRELLIGALLVLVVYIAEMLLLMRSAKPLGWRVWQKGAEAHANAHALAQSREVQSLELELTHLQEQVNRLQSEIEQMKAQQAAVTPYTNAIQMAEQGLNVSDVASRCGISRGEAELIVAMHQSQSS